MLLAPVRAVVHLLYPGVDSPSKENVEDTREVEDTRAVGVVEITYLTSRMPLMSLYHPKVMMAPMPSSKTPGRKPRAGKFLCVQPCVSLSGPNIVHHPPIASSTHRLHRQVPATGSTSRNPHRSPERNRYPASLRR